ncbi:hypothetical protein ACP275_08G172900 [Erythranthe tilingii]
MVAKDYNKTKLSTKAEVGEIDTSAPFQSVKDAVSLFGEGAFSGEKPPIRKAKPQSADRVLEKETQLHLVEKELNRLKEQLQNAETTKSQALFELEKAKTTVWELSQKLESMKESKNSAKQSREVDNFNSTETEGPSNRAEYTALLTELDAAKNELKRIRRDYEAAKQGIEAEKAVGENIENVGELSKEIATVKGSIKESKLPNKRAKEEEIVICADMDKQKQSCKNRLEELVKKLPFSKKNIDHDELIQNLENELCETLAEIEAARAKESLRKVEEEGNSERLVMESLKVELNNLKTEHYELKEKGAETETIAGNLHVKLRKAKFELEEAIAEEAKSRGASDEMVAAIRELAMESSKAKQESEEMKAQVEKLNREAEAARIDLEEAETKLKVAAHEAEESKSAEAKALEEIQILSEKINATRMESGARIVTLSREEFDWLSRKTGECEKLAEMKVSALMAEVAAVKVGENEAMRRWECAKMEIEDMRARKVEAVRKAEMAEAAKKAVEGELRRWRECEEKKAGEVAAVAEKQKQKPVEMKKLEKAKTSASVVKKVMTSPGLSSVFYRKKNHGEGCGSSTQLSGQRFSWS